LTLVWRGLALSNLLDTYSIKRSAIGKQVLQSAGAAVENKISQFGLPFALRTFSNQPQATT
jgi:hypothetical protein